MKVVKARYYEETQELIPLDPQPLKIAGVYQYERSGTDDKGSFVVIDMITEGNTFLEYDSLTQRTVEPLEIIITEEEWNKPININLEDTTESKESNVNVDVTSLQKLPTTNLKMKVQTFTMATKKFIQSIKQYCLNVYNAILYRSPQ